MAGKEIEALSYIKKPTRRPGRLKGKIKIAKDFDDPISEKSLLYRNNLKNREFGKEAP